MSIFNAALSSLLPLFSQANSNEIVLASTHDVQEVDVSTLVAVQPYTWIGDDFDKESHRSDSGQLGDGIFLCPQRSTFSFKFPQTINSFSISGDYALFYSSDDIDHRSSHTNIAQSSSVPFAPPQMPVSASMPWLGSGQTSMGASVVGASSPQTDIHKCIARGWGGMGNNGYAIFSNGQQGDTMLCFRANKWHKIPSMTLQSFHFLTIVYSAKPVSQYFKN